MYYDKRLQSSILLLSIYYHLLAFHTICVTGNGALHQQVTQSLFQNASDRSIYSLGKYIY